MSKIAKEIGVEPKLLVWARETVGKPRREVASKLRISERMLEEWESGESKPTLTQAEKLARAYKRPLAVFFLAEPPAEKPRPQDFRTMSSKRKSEYSSSMLLVVRRARRLQALATELAQNTGHDLSLKLAPFTVYDDPESRADTLRKQLGISSETQTSVWRNERQALAEWKSTIENLGIMILQIGMPLAEARGFSLVGDGIPVIVLNARDAQRAQVFSLFHECAHLALNNFGICDMRDGRKISAELTKIERFCNHFAGALLLPRQLVQDHPLVSGLRTGGRVPDETLMALSESFKVSQEVVLRRLVILGKASTEFYEAKRKEWQKDVKKQTGGRANPPKKCIRENGLPFVSLVFNAFREEKITYRDVADYLTIKAKHLPRVEQLIGEMAYLNEAAI